MDFRRLLSHITGKVHLSLPIKISADGSQHIKPHFPIVAFNIRVKERSATKAIHVSTDSRRLRGMDSYKVFLACVSRGKYFQMKGESRSGVVV